MRRAPIIALLALSACGTESVVDTPPLERLYFPTGIVHVDDPANPNSEGRLYVASSDFDKRWDVGSVTALDLDAYALPELPSSRPEPLVVEDLKLDPKQQVYINPFAGQMIGFDLGAEGGIRLVVPSRAEGDHLYVIDAKGTQLSCSGAPDPNDRHCQNSATSLTQAALDSEQGYTDGKPRAPEPFAVAVDHASGDMMVTHLDVADSPYGSQLNRSSFVVQTNARTLQLGPQSYVGIGEQPAAAVALGSRFAYLTGRQTLRQDLPAVRLVDRLDRTRVIQAGIEGAFQVNDTRGIAVWPDPAAKGASSATIEQRLFVLGRSPDVLLVIDVLNPLSDSPTLRLVNHVPLPAGPNQIRLIPRASGKRALMAISCTDSDSVALYDDETGTLATEIAAVGSQPFDIAVRKRGTENSARMFVTNFNDGRIAVIDIPDVNAPYNAFVSAHLGASQTCLVTPNEPQCAGVKP